MMFVTIAMLIIIIFSVYFIIEKLISIINSNKNKKKIQLDTNNDCIASQLEYKMSLLCKRSETLQEIWHLSDLKKDYAIKSLNCSNAKNDNELKELKTQIQLYELKLKVIDKEKQFIQSQINKYKKESET